ncbi:Fc.00g023720.m01.CDS01 [Cosmosporella sp. VM-42]
MSHHGFLVPDSYVFHVPSDVNMNLSSIFWGFSFAVAVFSALRAGSQSLQTWRRKHRVTAYIAMIWTEWAASIVIGAVAWSFQRQYVRPSFQLFFVTACFWSLQIQLLMQIIINRIALLMPAPGAATRLKWAVFLLLLLVNISVLVIWIPAQLQISPRWIKINEIWDRCEKVIFAIIDLSLNLRFIFLVRSRLISHGLVKYVPLFRFNCVMICFSISLDIALIGLMSLPSKLVYLQFHPVAYLIKLFIEMNMAELIAKVAREPNRNAPGRHNQIFQLSANRQSMFAKPNTAHVSIRKASVVEEEMAHSMYPDGRIHVTVETAVTRKSMDSGDGSTSESSLTRGV